MKVAPRVLLLICLATSLTLVVARKTDKPNVIIFNADDVGLGDFSVNGHPTQEWGPVDDMAREGMRLTNMYAAAPICTPSRAGLMTADAIICHMCNYIVLEGSSISEGLPIPGSDDSCITNDAPTTDCDIYNGLYGEVTQCMKIDTLSQISSYDGTATATYVTKQCDIIGISTNDRDHCLASNETTAQFESISESIRTILGSETASTVHVLGDVCFCDSDMCNTAMTYGPALLHPVLFALLAMIV